MKCLYKPFYFRSGLEQSAVTSNWLNPIGRQDDRDRFVEYNGKTLVLSNRHASGKIYINIV